MRGLLLLAAAFSLTAAASPAPKPFTLTSTSFVDGQAMPTRYAGNLLANPNCVGTNQTPALGWRNPPEGTKSLVFFMIDPEGRGGLGVTHWVAYNVPVERSGFAANEIALPPKGYSGGKSTQGLDHYIGPCTPPNTSYHHYTFLAIATDLAPGALAAGLTREELTPLLQGHAKGSTGLVMRFRHP